MSTLQIIKAATFEKMDDAPTRVVRELIANRVLEKNEYLALTYYEDATQKAASLPNDGVTISYDDDHDDAYCFQLLLEDLPRVIEQNYLYVDLIIHRNGVVTLIEMQRM